MNPEIKDYIDKEMNDFKISIKEVMNSLKDELIIAVENKIETKVNGKIDKIARTLEAQNIVQAEQSKKLDELKPIREKYRDTEGAKRIFGTLVRHFLELSGVIGAWYVIKEFLIR